jgi:molecular chaperone IbpA
MRSFDIDLSPLFRSTVGFDRLGRLLESTMQAENAAPAYPPYNIEKLGDDAYRIVMAVAGFGEGDLDVTVKEGTLTITGKSADDDKETKYLHRGIAGRAFERRFQLADHIRVEGATLENGLLTIELVREVPEALKPRQITIESGAGRKPKAKTIEHEAA